MDYAFAAGDVLHERRLLSQQLASEPDKERVYLLVGEHSRDDAYGIPQVCFIGVIDPLNPRVETAETRAVRS